MSIRLTAISLGLCMVVPAAVFAAPVDPCEQIVAACQSVGFVKGDAKAGFGVFADCFDPILGGKEPSNDSKRLPSVSPTVVAACKVQRARK